MLDETPKDATQSEAKKSSSKFMLPIILAAIVIAAIGYMATMKRGLDQQIVEAQLDEWAKQYKYYNPNSDLRYGTIEMAGGVSDRHAIVHDVAYAITQQTVDGETEDKVVFSTPKLIIKPENISFDSFTTQIPGPIQFENAGAKMLFSYDPPLESKVTMIDLDGSPAEQYVQNLTGVMTIVDQVKDETVFVTLGEGSRLEGKHTVDTNQGDSRLILSSLKAYAESKPDQVVTLGSLNLDMKWHGTNEKQGAISTKIAMDELYSDEDTMPYGPINAQLDLDYSGPFPKDNEPIDWATRKALFDLRNLTLSMDDVALKIALNFQTGRGEMLPVGEGEVTFENFAFALAELRKKELVAEDQETLLSVLAKQITGTDLDAISDLNIPLRRVDGGSLQVGQSNFEELFAIFLTGGNVQPQPAPEPAPVSEDADDSDGEPDASSDIDEKEVKELFDAK